VDGTLMRTTKNKAKGKATCFVALMKFSLSYSCLIQCFDAVLGSRKGIRPVKTEWWGVGAVICLGQGEHLHMAQLMPLPLTVILLQ